MDLRIGHQVDLWMVAEPFAIHIAHSGADMRSVKAADWDAFIVCLHVDTNS